MTTESTSHVDANPLGATTFLAELDTAREAIIKCITTLEEVPLPDAREIEAAVARIEALELIAERLVLPVTDEIRRAHVAMTARIRALGVCDG